MDREYHESVLGGERAIQMVESEAGPSTYGEIGSGRPSKPLDRYPSTTDPPVEFAAETAYPLALNSRSHAYTH
jgi:hypothetical protein